MNKKQRNILLVVILITTLGLISAQTVRVLGVRDSKISEFDVTVKEGLYNVVTEISNEETITQVIDQLPTRSVPNHDSLHEQRQVSKQGVQYISRNQKVVNQQGIDSMAHQMPNFLNDSGVVKFLRQREQASSTGSTPSKGVWQRFLVQQIVERLIVPLDVPIEQRVTIEQIDTLLAKEFKILKINLPYEIGVSDEEQNIVMSSGGFHPEKETVIYEKRLFPNDPDGLMSKYYVRIYFPKQSAYLLSELISVITTSILLIILVLSIFGYTLFVIFKQKKISEIKNDFISNITHELKTPIATISLAAQMLDDSSVADNSKNVPRLSSMIKNQSKHLIFLVEKVLQSSIFEKGIFVLKLAPESMHKVIHEAMDNLSLQLQNKKAVTNLSLEASSDVFLFDKSYMLNAISNLIDNALKYCPAALELNISTENKDGGILITVSDNGIGIDKIYHTKVFDPFFRVPSGNVHNVKGFGLGLSYVKKIVDAHHGHIHIESKLGQGTRFLLWFPLEKKDS